MRAHIYLALLGGLVACTPPGPSLDEVRAATERYQNVDAALAAGYLRDPIDACETPAHMGITEDLGAMGVHYLRPDLLGIAEGETRLDVRGTHTDFLEPAVLLYEPQADGSLELVALENIVSAEAWEAAGHDAPPELAGVPFAFDAADPGMMIGARWDLHVWLYRENPSGTFAPYNPDVTCAHHDYDMPMMMPPDSSEAPHH